MKSKSQPRDQERREFIKKSTLVGAGVAATAVAGTSVITDAGAASTEKTEAQGYQLTRHVLDYYKSAGI